MQAERRGTAHAVLCARAAIEKGADDILVVYGDTPLVSAETLKRLRGAIDHHASVAVLGFRPANPAGYGRLVMNGHRLVAIREERDASDIERKIDLCNGGLMALRGEVALEILDRIGDANAKREFYLTDAVAIADGMALEAVALETTEDEVRGSQHEGAARRCRGCHAVASARRRDGRRRHDAGARDGVPLRRHQVRPRRDGRAERGLRAGRRRGGQCGNPRLLASRRRACRQGRLGRAVRAAASGAKLGPKSRVGNFVEVKEAELGEGAKANHLAYIGDGRVGDGANIGAGTIFCNYDGANKHRTEVGKGAFIGSNSALVAPVKVGANAYVGSGSVITEDVPAGALALGRGRQVNKAGWKPKAAKTKETAKPKDASVTKTAPKPAKTKKSAKKKR